MFNWFKKEPPKPLWMRKPFATISIVLALLSALVFAPIGFLYDGVTEELNQKVDNKTLQLMLQNQTLLIQQNKTENERQREEDAKKFEALQKIQEKTLEELQKIKEKDK